MKKAKKNKQDAKSVVVKKSDLVLSENLTGGQIQEILDTLIHGAVSPIIRGCDAFDLQVQYILSVTARNRKRKLSSLPREEAITLMCRYLASSDREEKVRLVAAMRLERGFIYNFVVKFLAETGDYLDLYHKWCTERDKSARNMHRRRLTALERNIGCSKGTLFQTINNSQDYLRLAYTFRNSIVMKYVRHSFKQARSFVDMKGPTFDLEDVSQNFLAAVTKAVDKYDASKGALTSYINFWVLNAQTTSNSTHGHEYGVAYSIPQLQKKALAEKSSKGKAINFSVSLDKMVGNDGEETELGQYIAGDASVEEELTREEDLDHVRFLAKAADIRGAARLYLEVDEVFSRKEKRKMLRTMSKQLGLVPRRVNGEIKFEYDPSLQKKRKTKKQRS